MYVCIRKCTGAQSLLLNSTYIHYILPLIRVLRCLRYPLFILWLFIRELSRKHDEIVEKIHGICVIVASRRMFSATPVSLARETYSRGTYPVYLSRENMCMFADSSATTFHSNETVFNITKECNIEILSHREREAFLLNSKSNFWNDTFLKNKYSLFEKLIIL